MWSALDGVPFQNLLQAVAVRYEEVRQQNIQLIAERAQLDASSSSSFAVVGHKEQCVWQDWQLKDAAAALNDGGYLSDTDCSDVDAKEVSGLQMGKPIPSSLMLRENTEGSSNSCSMKTPTSGAFHKFSPSGRHDVCKVAPPVEAKKAPPQDVDMGLTTPRSLRVEDARACDPVREVSTMVAGFSTRESNGSSRSDIGADSEPVGPVVKIASENVSEDQQALEAAQFAKEKRLRKQFKRSTEPGRRRLFAWQIWKKWEDLVHDRCMEGPVPTFEQLAEALYQYSTLELHEDNLTRGSQVSANMPNSIPRTDFSVAQEVLDVSLDLGAFARIMLEDDLPGGLTTNDTLILTGMRDAMNKEADLCKDDDSTGSGTREKKPCISPNRLDTLSALVILANAVVIGLSTDIAEDHPVWTVFEIVFTIFFTVEMVYKMRLWGLRAFFIGPDWNWNDFDFFVVCVAILDLGFTGYLALFNPDGGNEANIGTFTLIKMARLGRLARLLRLLRFKIFEQLKMMCQGVIAGLRVLLWAVVLLFFFIYLLGVILRKTMGTSEVHHYVIENSFESVPSSMFTLFRCFTDGCVAYDGTPMQVHMFEYYGAGFMIPYMLVYLFVTMGIFNLIMAIFIDNVMEASVHRKQQERGASAPEMELALKELIAQLIRQQKIRHPTFLSNARNDMEKRASSLFDIDIKKSGTMQDRMTRVDRDLKEMNDEEITITRETFAKWLEETNFLTMLDDLDIGTSNKSELFDVLDCDLSGELEVPEVIAGLMKLRGPSDKSDAVASLLGIRYITQQIDAVHATICGVVEEEDMTFMQSGGFAPANVSELGATGSIEGPRTSKRGPSQRRSAHLSKPCQISVITGKPSQLPTRRLSSSISNDPEAFARHYDLTKTRQFAKPNFARANSQPI